MLLGVVFGGKGVEGASDGLRCAGGTVPGRVSWALTLTQACELGLQVK